MSAPTGYFDHARPDVLALCGDVKGRSVLDVGCGSGAFLAACDLAGARVKVGIEKNSEAVDSARCRAFAPAIFQYDLDHGFPAILVGYAGSFDLVVAADVLEHLKEPEKLLSDLRPLLSATGRIVVSIPNVRHESVLLPLLVHGEWTYRPSGILDRTHLRFFTAESAERLLAGAGFEVEEARAVTSPLRLPAPVVAVLRQVVIGLGGDGARFEEELSIVQMLVRARPLDAVGRGG